MFRKVWFCVGKKDEEKAFQYWQEHDAMILYLLSVFTLLHSNTLHVLFILIQQRFDNFFMPLQELAKAPFDIYVIKQREGDFVLVPPECVHQVVNKVISSMTYEIFAYIIIILNRADETLKLRGTLLPVGQLKYRTTRCCLV